MKFHLPVQFHSQAVWSCCSVPFLIFVYPSVQRGRWTFFQLTTLILSRAALFHWSEADTVPVILLFLDPAFKTLVNRCSYLYLEYARFLINKRDSQASNAASTHESCLHTSASLSFRSRALCFLARANFSHTRETNEEPTTHGLIHLKFYNHMRTLISNQLKILCKMEHILVLVFPVKSKKYLEEVTTQKKSAKTTENVIGH